jgi:hypothetical protein
MLEGVISMGTFPIVSDTKQNFQVHLVSLFFSFLWVAQTTLTSTHFNTLELLSYFPWFLKIIQISILGKHFKVVVSEKVFYYFWHFSWVRANLFHPWIPVKDPRLDVLSSFTHVVAPPFQVALLSSLSSEFVWLSPLTLFWAHNFSFSHRIIAVTLAIIKSILRTSDKLSDNNSGKIRSSLRYFFARRELFPYDILYWRRAIHWLKIAWLWKRTKGLSLDRDVTTSKVVIPNTWVNIWAHSYAVAWPLWHVRAV